MNILPSFTELPTRKRKQRKRDSQNLTEDPLIKKNSIKLSKKKKGTGQRGRYAQGEAAAGGIGHGETRYKEKIKNPVTSLLFIVRTGGRRSTPLITDGRPSDKRDARGPQSSFFLLFFPPLPPYPPSTSKNNKSI